MKKQEASDHLKIRTAKGFAFNIPHSIVLTCYPSIGIIFFLQSSIRFYDGANFTEIYRTENPISTISLRGKYLAIGQKMLRGQLTTTTVLNLETKQVKTFKFQKTIVQSLSLSADGRYLCSVGSSDSSKYSHMVIYRQQVLIIDVFQQLQFGFKTLLEQQYEKKNGAIKMAIFSNKDPNLLALVYSRNLSILRIDNNKVSEKMAKSSKVRQFSMALFDPTDLSCYLSSKNGDISEIQTKQLKQVRIGPRKRVIIAGIKHIRFVKPNKLIITGMKGFIALLELAQLKIIKQVSIKQEILSLTQFQGDLGFVATDKASIYILDASTLNIRQFYFSHSAKVSQICFLENYSEVFATCAGNEIILWRNLNLSPIIKISLPNCICLSLNLLRDGTSIISGWSDDCIRFFNPKTGKKTNSIQNAHNGKITALTSNRASDRIFSGGDDGRIRSWKIQKDRFGIIQNIFTGHKSQIHFLQLYDEQLYSCSEDGCFAVWNSQNGQKKLMVRASNFLKKVIPFDQYSVYGIGAGPNMVKITKNDGRILQVTNVGGSYLHDFDVAMTQKGPFPLNKFFVFGGELHSVILKHLSLKVDDYETRTQEYYAYGEVTCVKIAPDSNTLIAGTADGSLLCFEMSAKGFLREPDLML